MTTKYTLRQVTREDAEILFAWTNEEETRKNSFSEEPVLWENHIQWLEKKLADKNCLFFILTDGDKELGTIRLDIVDACGQISYSIDKNERGQGLGSRLLSLVEQKARQEKLTLLQGSVKPENKASVKCFMENGYKVKAADEKEIVYQKFL